MNEVGGVFKEWVCVFPGKMGLSWKCSWGPGTKVQAEAQARKNCNVVVIPLQLYENMKDHERRMVEAEGKLVEVEGRPGWNGRS